MTRPLVPVPLDCPVATIEGPQYRLCESLSERVLVMFTYFSVCDETLLYSYESLPRNWIVA